ncbi:MAG: hypothetical protein HND53_02330 [Proteobacteria bacterium]|nr:hypothetical protein [Pseudomonadota bacterium]
MANETSIRNYTLFNNGSLQLTVPDSWRDKTEQQLKHLPPTVTFTPLNGTSFHILLSPMWAYREGVSLPSLEDTKQLIDIAAEHAREQAVEGSIKKHEFKNTGNKGYYYSTTDKAPKPGEYKYMTQGMIHIGDLFATFTILTNDDSVDIGDTALKMINGAEHIN